MVNILAGDFRQEAHAWIEEDVPLLAREKK
jgi:hypothetical protein